MDFTESAAGKLKLIGGKLCLDFVNTVSGQKDTRCSLEPEASIPGDYFKTYFDLISWGVHTGVLSETVAQQLIEESQSQQAESEAVLKRGRKLREAFFRICCAVLAKQEVKSVDLDILNQEVCAARQHERLICDGEHFMWRLANQDSLLDCILWPIAQSAGEFLSSGHISRLAQCHGDGCDWVFEDTSRNRSRHWCSMEDCGNLAKVRRFRKRQKPQA